MLHPQIDASLTSLRRLQSALPTRCILTNSGLLPGSSLFSSNWGTAKDDDVPAWHLFAANSYKQMGGLRSTGKGHTIAYGEDGRTVEKGLARTVYLQCGRPEDNAQSGMEPLRFYTSLDAWEAANPETKAEPRRFEEGLGSVAQM